MRSANLRLWWKLAHRWIGLTLGLVLVLTALTGTLLTIARPLDAWIHADLFRVVPHAGVAYGPPVRQTDADAAADAAASADDPGVLERVRQRLVTEFGPQASFRLRLPQQPGDSLWARVRGQWEGTVYFDPGTAAELGRRNEHLVLVNLLLELHSTLLMGETGKVILAVAALAYLFLYISGLILWWPTRWRHALSIKLRVGPTRALFDLHRVGGALLGLLIGVSVVSGAYMAWRPLSAAVTALSGVAVMAVPALAAAPTDKGVLAPVAPLDLQVRNARAAMPAAKVSFIQLAAAPSQAVRVRLKLPDDPHPVGLSTVWLHPVTAQVLAAQRWDQLDPGARAYAVMYPLHIGELGGPLHSWAVALLGLTLAGFGVSGIWLWWRRRRTK